MKIFDTKTRKLEQFKPLKSSEVKIYYCGPTVYNYAHLGNLKTSVVEDIVVRTLKFLGYNVKTTMNITDIEDKTIRDSMLVWETLVEFTEKYTKEFLSDIEKLGIEPADNIVPISQLIPEMTRMIQTLLNRWYAYHADDGSVYYDISKFKKYWQLAHLDVEWMKQGVRIDNDEYDKDNVADFVLWKAWKSEDGENYWEQEFEVDKKKITIKWRPGWHIECSACAMKYCGKQIDIHMGGEDLVFPHHQNEIAQSEACTGKEFSKYWIHSGHLMVDGKKMSKSLGNFYNLRDIEEKFSDISPTVLYRSIRLSFINGYYRDHVDFSFEKLKQLIQTIRNIDATLTRLQDYESDIEWVRKDFSMQLQGYISEYIAALENDFSIPEALSVFFWFQKYLWSQMHEQLLSEEEKQSGIDMYRAFQEVLGIIDLDIATNTASEEIPTEISDLLVARDQAKKDKDFLEADRLRDEILELGYKIKDSREGSSLEKNVW